MAKQTPGFSGADLANLVNEAAILAARRNKKIIGMSEFEEAIDRVIAGPERKSRVICDAEKLIIAYHEGGHAVVQRILPKCDPVTKVTIVAAAWPSATRWSCRPRIATSRARREFEDKIAGMLGGHAAEEIVFGDTTTGASNDIEKATGLARRMVTEFGMSDRLGPRAFGKRDELVFLGREIGEQRNYSDDVAEADRRGGPQPHRDRLQAGFGGPDPAPGQARPAGRDPRREGDARRRGVRGALHGYPAQGAAPRRHPEAGGGARRAVRPARLTAAAATRRRGAGHGPPLATSGGG